MNSKPELDPEQPSQPLPEALPEPLSGPLRTGLLIAGSMLLGGLAVVLWNRSSLSRLRQPAETESAPVYADQEDE